MQFTRQHFIQMLGCLACASMAGLLGWYFGLKTALYSDEAVHLTQDISNYKLLEEGKVDHVKSNLGYAVTLDMQTYDQFQSSDPAFGSKSNIPTSTIEKGREIVQERKSNSSNLPDDSK